MALNGTMELIETVTVGSGGAASIDFQNIPQTYTDLKIVLSTRSSVSGVNDYPKIEFNGVSTNQTLRALQGNGSAASSYTDTLIYTNASGNTATASTFGNAEFYVPNYAGSSNKSVSSDGVGENNATAANASLFAGLWSSTAAITRVTIKPYNAGETFVEHSTATLYGISKVTAPIKATGGTVYDDADYIYHLFASSGTFTPNQALTADILVVGGGGGPGQYAGGGGGGGGVITFTNQSLSATGYTCTVGAGGARAVNDGDLATAGGNSTFGSLTSGIGGGGGGGRSASPSYAGQNGGSGGGGGGSGGTAGGTTTQTGTGATNYYGNNGGQGVAYSGAGGGGAGAAAATSQVNTTDGGKGGIGIYDSLINTMGAATSTGELSGGNYYFASGGAGWCGVPSAFALGGGGGGSRQAGLANTGGGGGFNASAINGNGGSGIVIVRYAK